LEHPGQHAVLTVCLRFSSVLDGVCAASFCQQATGMSAYKFTQQAVASPDAPQKALVHKKACSGGADWVQVTRHPAKQAKKRRTVGSQQPACTHKEHQILSTAEDCKVHPMKASQHEFFATCFDVGFEGEVCPNEVPALVRGAAMTTIRAPNNEWAKLCSACLVYVTPFAALCSPTPAIHF
jgi:hypothetical protein